MLQPAKQLMLSFHAELYTLVPENHMLRKIHAAVDFGFIHKLVEQSYCTYYGRPANEPELLFRLLFLQTLYTLSDERVVQEAQVNLAYKWFIGIKPEDSVPDAFQLSRFRNHRLGASQVGDVLKHVISQCIERGLVKSQTIIMDATQVIPSKDHSTCCETRLSVCFVSSPNAIRSWRRSYPCYPASKVNRQMPSPSCWLTWRYLARR